LGRPAIDAEPFQSFSFDSMPDRLTSRQRAHLRSLAHGQDPLVHIGKEGLTDAVEQSVVEAFNTRELVNIRVLDNAPRDVRDIAEAVAGALDDVQVVRTIGGTALLYRPHPEEPEITLPAAGGS
jgi:RNA-binding protein